ncbi:Prophage minor tail protein Z (GPZ) [Paenibacillus uliginis N3/975]|uniref:Prophage minor tail protein Z (GPZ) n=1 Tax=Paenibacillus uliginis N3/975 TaxID=1313296 RepID=A0A1X7HK33_9BACL|nr:phage tail protein [Paenibacillus uliginis]SMF88159.1 Prophage minor tail protein Z (GPZ) [Paenibacillus uliginis N3/975]
MSDFIDVKDNFKQVNRSLKQMDKAVRQAVLSSINRATQRAKTETGRKVREKYVIKQKEVVQTIRIKKAASNKLQATLTSQGHSIPLIKFTVAPKRKLKKAPKALKAAVYRGGVKKPIPGAFIATAGTHLGVFMRAGRKRLPIGELRGPAVPSMVGNEEVREHVQQVYGEEMEKRLPHELDRMLGRLKA